MTHRLLPAAVVFLFAATAAGQEAAPEAALEAAPEAYEGSAAEPEPIVIELNSGTRLRGLIVREDEDAVLLRTEALGELTIDADEIAQRLPANAALRPPVRVEKAEEPPPPGVFGTGLLAGWEKSIGLGFTGTSGDVNEFGINASLEGDYKDDAVRWRLRSAYFYSETGSEQTQGEGFANLRRDWLLPGEPTFLFAEGRTNYNDFQAWQFRLGGFGGVGVSIWNRPDNSSLYDSDNFDLLARVGAGASREFGIVDETLVEALFAVESLWNVTDAQTLRFSHTYFPELEYFQESRNVTEASYTIKIDQGRGLSLKTGFFNEYLSTTADDSSHNSLSYFGQLVYEF